MHYNTCCPRSSSIRDCWPQSFSSIFRSLDTNDEPFACSSYSPAPDCKGLASGDISSSSNRSKSVGCKDG
ncbi:hypothetical protein TNCV_3802671 [Trichonephila clavipes]|nr:hypothetical protein TNCV_3802671 [Trichonephila clavipes]